MTRKLIAAGLLAVAMAHQPIALAWGAGDAAASPAADPAAPPVADPAAPPAPQPAAPPVADPAVPPAPEPAAAPAAEPAPDPATYREWYYMVGQETAGPFAIGPMREEITAGKVAAETLTYVARNGWKPAREHPELADLFPAVAAPSAPPPPPAPAAPSQADLDQKALTYFLGTWHAEGAGQFQTGEAYRVVSEVSYLANGLLRGVATYTVPQSNYTGTTALTGTYTVRATSDTLFILSTDVLATGAAASDKNSSTFRIIGPDTIENTVSGARATRIK